MTNYTYSDELYHHGIKGQKWGVRRFQNPDGSLTDAGKSHYRQKGAVENEKVVKQMKKYRRGEAAIATAGFTVANAALRAFSKNPSAKSLGIWNGTSFSSMLASVVGIEMMNKKVGDLELDVNSIADAKTITSSNGPNKNASPKERAKYYEKELNNHDKWQGSMLAGATNRKIELDALNKRIAKKEFKKEDCSKEYAKKEKILKKMNDQAKAYDIIEKHTQQLVKKMSTDKDLLYMINRTERASDARSLYVGEYQTVRGNRYKVKTANARRGKSVRWNTKHKRSGYTPVRTTYYSG